MKISQVDRKRISKGIAKVLQPIYFPAIPLTDLFDVLVAMGYVAVQEDGRPWQGFLLGEDSECSFDIAKIGYQGTVDNAMLRLQWHRMSSGRYEVTGYLT